MEFDWREVENCREKFRTGDTFCGCCTLLRNRAVIYWWWTSAGCLPWNEYLEHKANVTGGLDNKVQSESHLAYDTI